MEGLALNVDVLSLAAAAIVIFTQIFIARRAASLLLLADRLRLDHAEPSRESLQAAVVAANRTLFNECPIGASLLTVDGKWLWVNHEVERILGRTSQELTSGMRWQDVTTSETLAEDERQVAAVLRGDLARYTYSKRYIHSSGAEVPVKITAAITEHLGVRVWSVFINDESAHVLEQQSLAKREKQHAEYITKLRTHIASLERKLKDSATKETSSAINAMREELEVLRARRPPHAVRASQGRDGREGEDDD